MSTKWYADKVAARWAAVDPTVRSFWQNPVVQEEINRRLTGNQQMAPLEYFGRRFCQVPRSRALSLGSGDGQLEIEAVRSGVCERVLGIDLSPERVARANSRVPAELRDRVKFVVEDLETYRPAETYDLIFCKMILHHIEDLEGWCEAFKRLLSADGVVYVDEFVGPDRFQWTDAQLHVVNRLTDALEFDLRRDLVLDDGQLRAPLVRPSAAAMISADPSEAIRSSEIARVLETRLEPLHVTNYGGALFHLYFDRIVGNFADSPSLVRTVTQADFLLTDFGVLEPNYLWGVYGHPSGEPEYVDPQAAADSEPAQRPELPLPPRELMFMKESYDGFRTIGDEIVEDLLELCRLRVDSSVLDVGSGYGRVAHALWRHGHSGAYLGLEILPPHVEWCRRVLTPATGGRMEFAHLDVQNDRYNPNGAMAADAVALPVGDATTDIAVLTSVFTHMHPAEVEHYLTELARVLKPGGRLLATFFMLDDSWQAAALAGRSPLAMEHTLPDGVRYHNAEDPLHAIGYPPEWIRRAAAANRFTVRAVAPGTWCGRAAPGRGYQDTVVLVKL